MTISETANEVIKRGRGRPKGSTKENLEQRRKLELSTSDRVSKMLRAGPKVLHDEFRLAAKAKILDLLSSGQVNNLTDAAHLCELPPILVHSWARWDKDFSEFVNIAKEVVADKLEAKLTEHENFIPNMMILKGLRPKYRDNFKIDLNSSKLEELLTEIKNAGAQPIPVYQIEGQVVDSPGNDPPPV